MIGRICTASTNRNQHDVSTQDTDDIKGGLSDYVCPECGSQRYHLVFRVEALSHRVTLSIACDVCSVRKHLRDDLYSPEEPYAPEVFSNKHFGTPHS